MSERPSDTIFCHLLVEMARLSSSAKNRLSSARALRQSPEQLVEAVRDLNRELDRLKRTAQTKFSLDHPIDVVQLPNGLTMRQAQSLQSHYFSLALDINNALAYPWSDICTYQDTNSLMFAEVQASWNTVAQISRSEILATRQISVDASCPAM
jgi:hypothetical protein